MFILNNNLFFRKQNQMVYNRTLVGIVKVPENIEPTYSPCDINRMDLVSLENDSILLC